MNKSKWMAPLAITLGLGLMSGCATNKEALEQTQSLAEQASDAAAAAQRSADQANNGISGAQQTADSADRTANAALQEARSAKSASDANSLRIDELNEKIERMFKQAMRK